MTEIIKTESGIEIILDKFENISSCSVGVFVKTGSVNELEGEEGISHILEHMIFKGTPRRNYFEISEETDYLGASINAYTTKEKTVFYINFLSEYTEKSLDILFDIVTNSVIDREELEKEKDVIIEEIKMYKDNPEDFLFELNSSDAIEGRYGKPIIGSEKSVENITSEMIKRYYRERYTKDNIIISVSGNFEKDKIIKKVDEYFGNLNESKVDRQDDDIFFNFRKGKNVYSKDIKQVNICITHRGVSYINENKIYLGILTNIVGGSMSSRLFQEIREKRGLAYSVYTYNQYYRKGGTVSTYIGTNKENYEKAIEIALNEFKKLKEEGISETELQKSKNKYLSQLAFSMENSRSRMKILASYYIEKNKLINIEEIKDKIEKINLKKINEFAKASYLIENITVLGNV